MTQTREFQPAPLTSHLRDALSYANGLRRLIEARDRGELADPPAIEREIERIELSIGAVLHLVEGPA